MLSGGGARGMAHMGVIEEIERRGFEITSIAGTSMGSLVGGAYATGRMQELKDWFYTLDRRKVLGLVDFTLTRHGIIRADKVLQKMQEYVPEMPIEELPIPYCAVAVDMIGNQEVVFREGSLYRAIRASIAIPGVITPVKEDHRLLVDGGVLNNIPMAHVHRSEGDMMIAVWVNADIPAYRMREGPGEEKKRRQYQQKLAGFYSHIRRSSENGEENLGYFAMASRVFDLMTMRMARDKIREFNPDVVIPVSREISGVYDFYKAEELVEAGRRAAVRVLSAQ